MKKMMMTRDDDNTKTNETSLGKHELEQIVRQTKLNTTQASLSSSSWDPEDSLKTGAIDDSNVKQQLTIVENGVLYSAKLYNDLKVKNEFLVKKLKRSMSALEEQKQNFQGLDAMKKAETEDGVRITTLKKEVEDIEDEITTHAHYARQLEHMQLRLKNNQLKFDTHMTAMEQSMPSILKEQEDVTHLRRCLGVAMGKAGLVLEETKAGLALAQKERECLMRKRLDEVRNAENLREWMQRRKEAKRLLALELRGDLSKDEERFLKDQINAKVTDLKKLQK